MVEKIDNTNLGLKIKLRKKAIEYAGGNNKAFVLDLFAGKGNMRKFAWAKVARYVGCDKKYSRPNYECIKGDNERLLPGLLKIDSFNIFDLDAYSNPFPLGKKICDLINPGEYQFILTDGINRDLSSKNPSRKILKIIDWNTSDLPHGLLCNFKIHDDIVDWFLGEWPVEINFMEWYQHKRYTQSSPRYYRIVLSKKP